MTRRELEQFGTASRTSPDSAATFRQLMDRLLPHVASGAGEGTSLSELLGNYGFDREQHEQIRADLKAGRIGLAQNRLSASASIEDVRSRRRGRLRGGAIDPPSSSGAKRPSPRAGGRGVARGRRRQPLDARGRRGQGAASVLQARGPAPQLSRGPPGQEPPRGPPVRSRNSAHRHHELHDAWTRSSRSRERASSLANSYGYDARPTVSSWLSPGRAVGLRMIPMVRDLRFAWEEMPQQLLDEQQQKSARKACEPR